ncbi:MAG TPA: sigma-70 family RNA polymerase sigma factor [Acidimicrobiia bacterium]
MNNEVSSEKQRRRRFEAVADEVFEPLQRYLRRRTDVDTAQDVLSDVLLIAWRRLDDVPEGKALPWCYGVARRTLANHVRGHRRHLRLVTRLEAEPRQNVEPDPAESGPDAELTQALSLLGEDDREIIRLWAWEHLEPREIAPIMDITVNAATLRLSRARARIAEQLARQDHAPIGHEPVDGTQETA